MSRVSGLREILFEGRWLRLLRHRDWEFVEHRSVRGIVVIVAVTADGRLLLVEQERIPLGRRVIELPAGLVGDRADAADEAFADAARRELLEETGYAAERLVPILTGPMSPGRSADLYSFFRAEGLRLEQCGGGDATEDIRVHAVPLSEVHAWLRAREREGVALDPKIYVGLYFVRHPEAA